MRKFSNNSASMADWWWFYCAKYFNWEAV